MWSVILCELAGAWLRTLPVARRWRSRLGSTQQKVVARRTTHQRLTSFVVKETTKKRRRRRRSSSADRWELPSSYWPSSLCAWSAPYVNGSHATGSTLTTSETTTATAPPSRRRRRRVCCPTAFEVSQFEVVDSSWSLRVVREMTRTTWSAAVTRRTPTTTTDWSARRWSRCWRPNSFSTSHWRARRSTTMTRKRGDWSATWRTQTRLENLAGSRAAAPTSTSPPTILPARPTRSRPDKTRWTSWLPTCWPETDTRFDEVVSVAVHTDDPSRRFRSPTATVRVQTSCRAIRPPLRCRRRHISQSPRLTMV